MKRYSIQKSVNTVAQDHGVVTAEVKMVEDPDGEWVEADVAISLENRLKLAMDELAELGQTSTQAMYDKAVTMLKRIDEEDDSYYRTGGALAQEILKDLGEYDG